MLLVVGCASPYQPFGAPMAVGGLGGFRDNQLQNDVFQITFEGNAFINKAAVEYYTLLRAAELTILSGHRYFVLLSGSSDERVDHVSLPGQTFVNTTGSGQAVGYGSFSAAPVGNTVYGSGAAVAAYRGNTSTTITNVPGQTFDVHKPFSTITIRALGSPARGSLDAFQLAQAAIRKGIRLDKAVVARVSGNTSSGR